MKKDERLKCAWLKEKLCTPGEAVQLIKNGMKIGTAGTISLGYPKTFFKELAKRVKNEQVQIELWSAAPLGEEVDGVLSELGSISKRLGMQSNPKMSKKINAGEIMYQDFGPANFVQKAMTGQFGELDVAIIEAVGITEEGHIIPSLSVSDSPMLMCIAKQIIIEINENIPLSLFGIHDIYIPDTPPNRKPISIISPQDKIGVPYIEVDPYKIAAIINCNSIDKAPPKPVINDKSKQIVKNVLNFLKGEVDAKRIPDNLLPIQSGLGSLGEAFLQELSQSEFDNLQIYSALLGDGVLDLLEMNKLSVASGAGLFFTAEGQERFFSTIEALKNKIILRPVDITNSPEVIQRLGVIAINSAIEVDIYAHINSSHLNGNRVLNGVGGSIEYARNGYISIFMTPSTAKDDDISAIVPMVSHVDHTEHEVDVIVTEWGWADLRGLDPREKAKMIIANCAHPKFRPQLEGYYQKALQRGGHEPQILQEAFCWTDKS